MWGSSILEAVDIGLNAFQRDLMHLRSLCTSSLFYQTTTGDLSVCEELLSVCDASQSWTAVSMQQGQALILPIESESQTFLSFIMKCSTSTPAGRQRAPSPNGNVDTPSHCQDM